MSFFADGASSTSLLFAAAVVAAFAGAGLLEMSPPITANCPPACTVLPSAARICPKTPAAGAGTSTLTLSVSNSQSISSCATVSPGFLYQVETVASVTDSPKTGTITATVCAAGAGALLAAVAVAAAVAGPEAAAPSLICANSASVLTVAPSAATISANVPATGLGTSTVTLSVSSSQSISSTAT